MAPKCVIYSKLTGTYEWGLKNMKYDAFISYRHTEPDMFVAKKVHKALETFKVPRKIRKTSGKKKIERVFRDQEELPIGSDLGNNIEAALEASEYLVVICSPRTKQSDWVLREIDTFIKMHGRDKALAVLVEGEPSDSFPEALLTDENGNPVEPLAADVRGASNREISKKLKTECMRLAAPILGCTYDDLRQRHRERKMRKYFAIAIGVATLGLAFGIYNAMVARELNAKNLEITKQNEEIAAQSEVISEKNTAMLINQSKYLSELSLSVYESGDRKTATLIALEGLPVNSERPIVPDSLYALSTALDVYSLGSKVAHDKVLKHEFTINIMRTNSDCSLIASSDLGQCAYLWDTLSGDLLIKVNPEVIDGQRNSVLDVSVLDGSLIVATKSNIKRFSAEDNTLYTIEFQDKKATYAKASTDGNLLLVNFLDYVELYNLENGECIWHKDNESDRVFSANIAFSPDKSLIAISRSSLSELESYVTLIDASTGEYTDLPIKEASVLDLIFTADGNLCVADISFDGLMGHDSTSFYVEKFDIDKKKLLWSRTLTYKANVLSSSYTRLTSKIYTGDDGAEHKEVSVCSDRNVSTLDLDTGSPVTSLSVSNDIQNILAAASSEIGFVVEAGGAIDVCDFTTGNIYPDSQIKVTENLRDAVISNGNLIAKAALSSEITIMSYTQGESLEVLAKKGNYISASAVSPNEKYLAVYSKESIGQSSVILSIYDSETGKEIASTPIEESIKAGATFINNDRVLAISYTGTIYEYCISEEKFKTYESENYSYSHECKISKDKASALLYNGRRFSVLNLSDYSETDLIEAEYMINKCTYNGDKDTFFGLDYGYNAFKVNVKTGETTLLLDGTKATDIAESPDGKLLALAGFDGIIRICDTKTGKVEKEIEDYIPTSGGFLQFSDDSKRLYYQPASLHFKIYDLENEKYLLSTPDTFNDFSSAILFKDSNTLVIKNAVAMYLIDCNSYGIMAGASGGHFYLPSTHALISCNNGTVYKFKYYEFNDLLKLAKERYGDAELSSEERIAYFLD